jgi:hypothetical protein
VRSTRSDLSPQAFKLASDAYCKVLTDIIREFKLDKAMPKIERMLQFAKMVPFSDDEQQADQLMRELLA